MNDSDSQQLSIDVATVTGHVLPISFLVREQTVEVWHHGSRTGVFSRSLLARWLSEPTGWVAEGAVQLTGTDRDHILLALPDGQWALSPGDLAQLRALVTRA